MNLVKYTHQALRVNLAGEWGACAIYKGQLDALKKTHPLHQIINHMYCQESLHVRIFEKLVVERNVRPTVLSPLWKRLGYVLGYGTGYLGGEGAMLCTLAVERVIDAHYQKQIDVLKKHEPALVQQFLQCQADEAEHYHQAKQYLKAVSPKVWHTALSNIIAWGTKCAIALSKKI